MTRWFSSLCGGLRGLLLAVLASAPGLRASYLDAIGLTRLQADFSAGLPTGSTVSVAQVEASSGTDYPPDATAAELTGKNFTARSATPTGSSGHATTVASFFYGNTSGVAAGLNQIDTYDANGWLQQNFLKAETFSAPAVESRDIQNHSWIAYLASTEQATGLDVLRRLDFAIQRDDFLAVAGVNNGSTSTLPELLAQTYNGLSVGLSSGNHSPGPTTLDGSGRVKPELVAPADATSWATPMVSGAAALLLAKARATTALNPAQTAVALKALLLAGADKTLFSDWARTTTRPLDATRGAGQLNLYQSYLLLLAGRQTASASAVRSSRGWDVSTTSATSSRRLYFFDLPANNTGARLSALLTWPRTITDGVAGPTWGNPTATLADLTLRLYQANGFTLGMLVDASTSSLDNLEHVYQPSLAPGRYALEVTAATAGVAYALAWLTVPTLRVSASGTAAEHGLAPGTFTVTRSGGDLNQPLRLYYTLGGTATAGTDYTVSPTVSEAGALVFAAGAATATLTVQPLADTVAEGDETIVVNLVADYSYALAADAATSSLTLSDLPFDAWRFARFNAAELADSTLSGDIADPDGDQLGNLHEYAFGTEPRTYDPASVLPFVTASADEVTLTYRRPVSRPDLTYTVAWSRDLETWTTGAGVTATASTTGDGETQTVVERSLASLATEPRQFLKLQVTR